MATQAVPDAASLNSWDEAFQYPLPTVRKLSTRLRRDIDEHRARLRSLVGTSYRDLLETAERIIDMDKQIQTVEHGLSDIGRRCNSGILERADTNYTQLERTWAQKGGEETRLRVAAQVKILAATLSVVSRLIKSEGEPLQAAKLMILARLLYKSLSDGGSASTVLERYRRSISSLRSKLLAYIDRSTARQDISTEDLNAALSAYALLTSSTAKDVLKHFLAVRTAQIEHLTAVSDAAAILQALKSYTGTFLAVQGVFPKRLAETLSTLSRVTLLSDKHIKTVDELSLDIYGRWIPDDIRAFTPWVQQDNLTAQEGRQSMAEYSGDAQAILLKGLQQCLAISTSVDAVLAIRVQVLGATLNMSTTIKTDSFDAQLESYRQVFMQRLKQLMQEAVSSRAFTISARSSTPPTSIWDLAQDQFDLTSGGINFRQAILRQRNGHDTAFDSVLAPYETWRKSVEQCWRSTEAMGAIKWEEYFEQDLEDGDDEDITSYQEMLSKEDATSLQAELHSSVSDAAKGMFMRVEKSAQEGEPQFFLRVSRELHNQHMKLSSLISLPDAETLIKHDLTRKLHVQLAQTLATYGIDDLRQAYSIRHFVPLDLWEGSPKLPLQPLPSTFKYVLTVQQEMGKIGEDIWTAAATQQVKLAVQDNLVDILQVEIVLSMTTSTVNGVEGQPTSEDRIATSDNSAQAVNGGGEHSKTTTNGVVTSDTPADTVNGDKEHPETTESGDTASDSSADKGTPAAAGEEEKDVPASPVDLSQDHIQRLFDALYLTRVFGVPGSDKLSIAVDTLKTRAKLQIKDIQRLERHAAEYWKKTYLLFGLLARSNSSYSK